MATYMVHFSGNVIQTTVTAMASDVDQWFREILPNYHGPQGRRQRVIVGLDCEWKPNTVRGFVNRTATLQLCIGIKCLIIQMLHLDYIPELLKAFCRCPYTTFVGAEVEDDVMKLWNDYGLYCENYVDIQAMAMQSYGRYYQKPSLKTLAWELTGMDMAKPSWVCRSDWEAGVLSVGQVQYAAIDAYSSYRVGHMLLNGY